MKQRCFWVLIFLLNFLLDTCTLAQTSRTLENDKQAVIALENEWLHAKDAATLDRILAEDFVHVIPADHFLSKQEHIEWNVKHPPAADRRTQFNKLQVRLYGDVAIVNGSVVATDAEGKELNRSMFTDVLVLRDGRWQAVNAQENVVPTK